MTPTTTLSVNLENSLPQNQNPVQQNWYTIEELASLSGFSVETLKHGENNLSSIMRIMSINFEVNTRLGGYHNTKKFYSENVLKALKEYQIKNSTPNAVKEKSTVIEGNVNFIQTDTFNKTIQGLLDNPDALLCLINESSKRIQALNTKLIEQQPKADYYDKFIDSTNLIEIGHLGKSTGIGEQKIFKRLVVEGYIKVRYSTDGVKYYDPCYGYEKYFKSVSVPFLRGEKQLNREKLMLTSDGYAYFMKKIGA